MKIEPATFPVASPRRERTRSPLSTAVKNLQPGGCISIELGYSELYKARALAYATAKFYGFKVNTTYSDGKLFVLRYEA